MSVLFYFNTATPKYRFRPSGHKLCQLINPLITPFAHSHGDSRYSFSSGISSRSPRSLETLHILTQELRDEVWSLALSDTTIIWGAITKTKSIALLSSSKTIRKEVVPTIIRTRCITLQTPAALSLLLRSCKTEEKSSANQREEADTPRSDKVEAPDANKSHTPDLSETDKPHLPSVPKKGEQ
jgi:hypothetical protein